MGPAAGLRIGPRRRRAGGRAIAGAFAITVAVVLVFGAWLESRPGRGTAWVVAAVPLAAGASLAPADLRTVVLDLKGPVAGTAFPDAAAVAGRTLAVPLQAGELVSSAELTPVGASPATRPVTLTVSGTDLEGLVAGERVDVLETTTGTQGARTALLLRGAELMRASGGSSGFLSAGAGSGGSDVVTLGVSDLRQVVALVAAERAGVIDIVPAETSDGAGLVPASPAASSAGVVPASPAASSSGAGPAAGLGGASPTSS